MKDGNVVKDLDDVLQTTHTFYLELYADANTKNEIEISNFLKDLDLPHVSPDFSSPKTITEDDVLEAIKKLNPGKSPGPDGFSPDFHLQFALFLSDLLARTFNEIFLKGSLPYLLAQAVIVSFFKKGDDLELRNYCPISLTNFDYKILAYIIASRMEPTFEKCIHPSQTAYLKGKFIGTNIRKVQDTMLYINSPEGQDSIILFFGFL